VFVTVISMSSWFQEYRRRNFASAVVILTLFSLCGLVQNASPAIPRRSPESTISRPSPQTSTYQSDGDDANERLPASKLFCTTVHRTAQTEQHKCHLAHLSDVNRKNVLPFRNKHVNQTAVLLCTGPTLQQYTHTPTDELGIDIITVGVNGIIFSDTIRENGLDYLFVQDSGRLSKSPYVHAFRSNVGEYTKFRCNIQKFFWAL